MFCTNCGRPLLADSKFCGSCGKLVQSRPTRSLDVRAKPHPHYAVPSDEELPPPKPHHAPTTEPKKPMAWKPVLWWTLGWTVPLALIAATTNTGDAASNAAGATVVGLLVGLLFGLTHAAIADRRYKRKIAPAAAIESETEKEPLAKKRNIFVGLILLLNALIGLGFMAYAGSKASGSSSTPNSVLPWIFDIVLGIGLLAQKKKWVKVVFIRGIIGLVLWGAILAIQADWLGLVEQVVLSAVIIILTYDPLNKLRFRIGAMALLPALVLADVLLVFVPTVQASVFNSNLKASFTAMETNHQSMISSLNLIDPSGGSSLFHTEVDNTVSSNKTWRGSITTMQSLLNAETHSMNDSQSKQILAADLELTKLELQQCDSVGVLTSTAASIEPETETAYEQSTLKQEVDQINSFNQPIQDKYNEIINLGG
jgi:hypothetical protein